MCPCLIYDVTSRQGALLRWLYSQGCVLVSSFFNVYISDLPPTESLKFGYADDWTLATQSKTFSHLAAGAQQHRSPQLRRDRGGGGGGGGGAGGGGGGGCGGGGGYGSYGGGGDDLEDDDETSECVL